MKEQLQLRDFLQYTYLNNLQINPKANAFAYVHTSANEEDNAYTRNLYVWRQHHSFQLTNTGKESMYLWLDEETILFSSVRTKQEQDCLARGEEATYFYKINIHGGEAIKAFTIPYVVTSMKQIKGNVNLFTANYDLQYSGDDQETKSKEKKAMEDYEVLDELPFYGNGQGFTNKTRTTLFLYEEETNTITQLSKDTFALSSFVVMGDDVYYCGEDFTSTLQFKDAIYKVNLHTLQQEEVVGANGFSISKLLVVKEELYALACNHACYGMNENDQFYKVVEHDLQLYCANEEAIGSSVGSDCRYGGGCSVKVFDDEIYFITTRLNRSILCKVNRDGVMELVYDCEGSVDEFDLCDNRIVFIGMQQGKLQEVYTCDLKGNKCKQVSVHNEEVLKNKYVAEYERCSFEQDGISLYGWVLKPKDFDPNKTYPAILDIHGGPKTVYGEVFYHEMQVWANLGYFVFFMNPRGGDGRGNEFADLRGKYGTIDYEDLMKFTDIVLEQYPTIDPHRVGVTGGSYGGFMTNWIIGHTQRFKAAASQRSISNWLSFAYTSDIGYFFASDQQAGTIFEDTEKLWWHSPLKYAKNVTTPTLFIHSDEDYRCPISEGYQMYSALRHLGVDSRMCVFHGENHELSRSGKPKHRIKRLEEITNWFEQYMK